VFLCDVYDKYRSYKKYGHKFRQKLHDVHVQNIKTIMKYVNKFHATGSILGRKEYAENTC
jgi:hypothetical protein